MLPFFQRPTISPWLFFLSRFDFRLEETEAEEVGAKYMASTVEGDCSDERPIFLRISSLGAVAISISSGVSGGGEDSFGTRRMIVPPWVGFGSD
jgi:hypothetical protein